MVTLNRFDRWKVVRLLEMRYKKGAKDLCALSSFYIDLLLTGDLYRRRFHQSSYRHH